MKNTILKSLSAAAVATALILSISSCKKTELTPTAVGTEAAVLNPNSDGGPMTLALNPVWGVNMSSKLFNVDPATGVESNFKNMLYTGGLLVPQPTGIAKWTTSTYPNQAVVSTIGGLFCGVGSGTCFFNVDLTTGTAARMGFLPGISIRDIEFNPVTHVLYGFIGNDLIKITGLGSACSPGYPGTAPTYVVIGTPSSVGVGPYSMSFNYAGQCNVISATDHKRAIVDHTLSTLPILGTTHYTWATTNMINPQEVAMCISKNTILMATRDQLTTTPTITNDFSFYHWTFSAGVCTWVEKSNNCAADYTSFAQNPTVIIDRP